MIPQKEYPQKLYYKINEVAKITDLKPHVLRYWETEFKELAPRKDENDQRQYRAKDLDMIFEIKHLLYEEGFTIKGARQQLKSRRRRKGPEVVDVPKKERAKKSGETSLQQLSQKLSGIRRDVADLCAYLGA